MNKSSTTSAPALFLDRDGTLNEDSGYPDAIDKIVLIDGVLEAVRRARELGYRIVVVTNQSGVARGYFAEQTVRDIHDGMAEIFRQHGAAIDAFYYCPYHIDGTIEEYRRDADCRKPAPGMLKQAAEDLDLDLDRSVMIGDKYSDIGAGKALGLTSILVLTGAGEADFAKYRDDENLPQPDHVTENLPAALDWLIDLTD